MGRPKRSTEKRRRPAAAAADAAADVAVAAVVQAAVQSAAASSSPSALNELAAATVGVSALSLSAPAAPDSAPAADATDSDSAQQPPRRKRKKTGKYHTPLTDQQRLDILSMHINEGKTASTIVRVWQDRGITVPIGTVYTLIRKQALGQPLGHNTKRARPSFYKEEDKQLILEAQAGENKLRYDQLQNIWREQHPDSTRRPSHDTLHRWLASADFSTKLLVPVPVARNEPANIAARAAYCTRAMGWERDTLVFIDETSFDRGLHQKRGRSKKGTPATFTTLNSPGPGLKVCAAVSPVLGLVMYEPQLNAWNGDDFARFITRLCQLPAMKHQSMKFVMDNVRVHHTEVVKDALRGALVHHDVEFLPVYSPHLNPIEYCFHNWKTEIKHIDQLHEHRTLQTQLDDTRTCITDHLVTRILDHVYLLYSHCVQLKPLEEFKPLGHRVHRAQMEAERHRQSLQQEEKKE